jgi:tetratricopeptide (TPR) repeat protein
LVGFLKHNRCKLCHTYRGNRFCLRRNKNICWHDCNEMRIDYRCPEACAYTLRKSGEESLAIGRCKVDSVRENIELNRALTDQWLLVPSKDLDDQVPIKLAETTEGKAKLTHFIDRIPSNMLLPLNYLCERLNIPFTGSELPPRDYETRSDEYLNLIVQQRGEETIPYLFNSEAYESDENIKSYLNSLLSQPLVNKMKHFELISSAYSKEGNEGLVFYDINYKDDLTLHWKKKDEKWLLWAKIGGNPQAVYGEKSVLEHIENLLGQQKYHQSYETLKRYTHVYQDSADMEYHWGLYYSLQADKKAATEHYSRSILLDPDFHQARFNLAFVLQADNQLDAAEYQYEYLLAKHPKDTKVMNNLAIIAMMKNDLHKAKILWEQCYALEPNNENVAKNLEHFIKSGYQTDIHIKQ